MSLENKKNLNQISNGFDENYFNRLQFNGGLGRQDFEQLETELEKTPLSSTLECISLYQAINEDFSSKWDDLLTQKQKLIYKR